MKKICVLLVLSGLAFALTSCADYHSLPEPELPVLYFDFSGAEYSAEKNTVTLTVGNIPNEFFFDGIYSYYNADGGFNMNLYLENGIGIKSARVPYDSETEKDTITKIIIELSDGARKPAELIFKTTEPMYLYTAQYEFWTGGHDIIGAKAFIKTQRLPVSDAAVTP